MFTFRYEMMSFKKHTVNFAHIVKSDLSASHDYLSGCKVTITTMGK